MRLLVPPRRILVRAPSWLGDFVACEPVLRALDQRYTAAGCAERLTIAAPAPFLELLGSRYGRVRRLACPRGVDPDPVAWREHEVALLLDGSFRSAWAALRAGIPERIGWSGGARGPWLTCAARPALERGGTPLGLGIHGRGRRRLPRPFAAACIELASLAGLDVVDRVPRIEPDPAAVERARVRLARHGVDEGAPFVALNAGGRAGSAKSADPAVLARIAREFRLPIVLVCGPGEESNARATLAECRADRALLLDDPPPNLVDLVAILSLSAAFVTADSGPRHLARALGKPISVVFGPTDPRHTAEHKGTEQHVRTEVDCGPCHRETCPFDGDRERACMRPVDDARSTASN